MSTTRLLLLSLLLTVGGCECEGDRGSSGSAPSDSSAASPSASTASTKATPPAARTRIGSTVALTEAGDAVLIAEEDRSALWRLNTPVSADSSAERHDLPGRPAQVLPLADRVLVTIRDPGLLLVLDGATLKEAARVTLPADAWGVAVTRDAKTAVVTSAWTHAVTGVDLVKNAVRWTVDVAREPRGVVIPLEGARDGYHAYVTHLVGTELTRIDGLTGDAPTIKRVALPAAASRNPDPKEVSASLGYAAVLSPDESHLFLPRLALGALGGWEGAPTVDVLVTASDGPAAPAREKAYRATTASDTLSKEAKNSQFTYISDPAMEGPDGAFPMWSFDAFVQPRGIVYRRATKTLLVASEGTDELVELDARWLEPALMPRKRYRVGGGYDKAIVVPERGGAPSGVALSPDESKAYVFCRTTSDLAVVPLVPLDTQTDPHDTFHVPLGQDDPLLEGVAKSDPKRRFREAAAVGRKLFYNALDDQVSGGLACAGCHPEGRDDGHVWIEAAASQFRNEPFAVFVGGPPILRLRHDEVSQGVTQGGMELSERGRARQTPMLAGRVRGDGAFGWKGESEDLVARIEAGFRLHRWGDRWTKDTGAGGHAGALASFLLSGLVEPPRPDAPLTAEQERGKTIFDSDQTGCAACHMPEDKFSNWVAVKVNVPGPTRGFIDESADPFKTPSLHFVGGTPPYYHDGSVDTLEELIERNGNRMGNTAHLSKEDQMALVAYLRTL